MRTPSEKAAQFHALHRRGAPLTLVNIWDPGSARIVAATGAPALATGSWSVAHAFGAGDGEQLPLDLVCANLERIAAAVDVPVSLDVERGYGAVPDDVAGSVKRVVKAGAVGINLEDGDGAGVRPLDEAADRVSAARAGADAAGVKAFINARTDLFLRTDRAAHDVALIDAAVARAGAYAAAGADGFFAPGLADDDLIARLCAASPLPVNIMANAATPPKARLAELGVARISLGPGPYRAAMAALEALAKEWG
jgi:2-methylisocitrate lyase-like PEP mutase family enzyme